MLYGMLSLTGLDGFGITRKIERAEGVMDVGERVFGALTLTISTSLTVSDRESTTIIFILEAVMYPYTTTSSIVYNNPRYSSVLLGFAVT